MHKPKYVKTVEKETSVKRISILRDPTPILHGRADFTYLPVFSVFDYGTIHPPVPLDNSTICLMAGYNFEVLQNEGIPSHMLGIVGEDFRIMTAHESVNEKLPITTMRVRLVNRTLPEFKDDHWDYEHFQNPEVNNYVVPLECITRNGLPKSSSVWKRIKRGDLTLTDLGLPEDLQPGDNIPEDKMPLLDYSTKFEPEDRYITAQQALKISGLSTEQFKTLQDMQKRASEVMTDYAASRGFERKDGKVEFVRYTLGEHDVIQLGDAVCTWHEDRLVTPQGVGISKQRIRNEMVYYNPEWYAEINRAKKQAKDEGHADFRNLMDKEIIHVLPPKEFFDAVNKLFQAGTNQWVDNKVYDVFEGKDDTLEDELERAVEEFQKVKRAQK